MGDAEVASFPIRHRGNRFEDFTVGRTFAHHWGRTITDGDASLFASLTLAHNPLFLNAEHARSLGHPNVVVSPLQVLCTTVGLSVEDLSEAGGPFLGVDDCTFPTPVHPGDTITASSTVIAARESASRPTAGIVTWRTEGTNQRGELVVALTRTNLIAKRDAPSPRMRQ